MAEQKCAEGKLYLLNSPVLPDYGDWRLEGLISVSQARMLLAEGFISAIGHTGTAELLSKLVGVPVPLNRVQVEMQRGDRALVLRVKRRLPEGVVLSAGEMERVPFELALLSRLA